VDRLKLASETADAIAHLHTLDIVHRDLKSLNVMCSEAQGETTAYLGDFGESVTVEEAKNEEYRQIGTLPWMAPEIIDNWKVTARRCLEDGTPVRGNAYSKASDCFSLAIIVWECEVQRAPYSDFPLHPKRKKPLLDADRFMLGDLIQDEGLRPNTQQGDVIPAEVLAMLEQGWDTDPMQRMAAWQMKSVIDAERTRIQCNDQGSKAMRDAGAAPCREPEVLVEMTEGGGSGKEGVVGPHASADSDQAQPNRALEVWKDEAVTAEYSPWGEALITV